MTTHMSGGCGPTVSADAVRAALDRVPDPCMDLAGTPASIVELGLVRGVAVDGDGGVRVTVTFTEVGCAYTHAVLDMVHRAVEAVPGVRDVETEIVWTPTWSPEDLMAPARSALAAAKTRLTPAHATSDRPRVNPAAR